MELIRQIEFEYEDIEVVFNYDQEEPQTNDSPAYEAEVQILNIYQNGKSKYDKFKSRLDDIKEEILKIM